LKVLLDENLPHSLRLHLGSHEVQTAVYAGFAGSSNGRLLDAAEEARFDVLVTGDRTLHYEQNLTNRKIAIVSLSTINWPILELHIAEIVRAVDAASSGSFIAVNRGTLRR
jgi:hypothetical protein